jgi:hypothetical protein
MTPSPIEGSEEKRIAFKIRIGTLLKRMREQSMVKNLSTKAFADRLGCGARQITRAESGTNLSFEMVELYELACGDQLLTFVGSEHPPGCTGNLSMQRDAEEKVRKLETEIASLKVDNGRLRGTLKRYERLIQELRAAGLIG